MSEKDIDPEKEKEDSVEKQEKKMIILILSGSWLML